MPLLLFCRGLDWINLSLGKVFAWCILPMILIQVGFVAGRELLNAGSLAVEDSILYMHAALIVFGLAHTLKTDGHVRVDIFYHRFSPVVKSWVNTVGSILFLMPYSAFIFFASLDYALSSFSYREASGDAGGLDLVYILKAFLPIAGALMFLNGISTVLRNLIFLTTRDADDD